MEKINENTISESQASSRTSMSPISKATLFVNEPSSQRKEFEKLIEARKSAQSDAEPRQSILPMHRKLTCWQRLDNWLWINSQNEFQLQCRNVKYRNGKEYIVILHRVFWVVILTFQLSIDKLQHGTFGNEIKYMQKWGLWLTYLTFMTGLFACDPPPTDASVLLKSYKNSPFQAWKWFTILFEMSLTLEIIITVTYWTILHKDANTLSVDWKVQTNLYMDHVVPIIALIIEFFLSYQPILKRHAFILLAIMTSYLLFNIGYTIAGKPPYDVNEWHTLMGALTCLGTFGMGLVLFYLLEMFTRIKLQKSRTSHLILRILSKRDQFSDTKFSEGSNSISKKQLKMLQDEGNFQQDHSTGKLSGKTIALDGASQNVGSLTMKMMPQSIEVDGLGDNTPSSLKQGSNLFYN